MTAIVATELMGKHEIRCSCCEFFCGYSSVKEQEFMCPACSYLKTWIRWLFDPTMQHAEFYVGTHHNNYWANFAKNEFEDVEDKVQVLKDLWSELHYGSDQ